MAPRRTTQTTDDEAFPTTSAELARVIAQAIAQHEATRADSSGGSGGPGRRRTNDAENGKSHSSILYLLASSQVMCY